MRVGGHVVNYASSLLDVREIIFKKKKGGNENQKDVKEVLVPVVATLQNIPNTY